jgi:hypothetical protein
MKRKHLYRIGQLINRTDDYRFYSFNNIRVKRYVYLLFYTPVLIIACLSYGDFIDFTDTFIKDNEILIAFFCFANIVASIIVIRAKREYHSIRDFTNLNDEEAKGAIRKLKEHHKKTLDRIIDSVATDLTIIITVIAMAILVYFKGGVKDESSANFTVHLMFYSWGSLLIAFIVGDILKMRHLKRNHERARGPETNTRNVFIDNLSISKINPELNE